MSMDKWTAREKIGHLARFGRIRYSHHFKERMAERGVSPEDLLFVFSLGKIINVEFSPEYQNHKYTLHGQDIEGEPLTIILTIDEWESVLVLITVC